MKRLFLLLLTILLIIQIPCYCDINSKSVEINNFYYKFTEKDTYKKVKKSITEYNNNHNMENLTTITIENFTAIPIENDSLEQNELYICGTYIKGEPNIKILIGEYNEKGVTIYSTEFIKAIDSIYPKDSMKNLRKLYFLLIDNGINTKKIDKFIKKLSDTNEKIGSLLLPILLDDVTVGLKDYRELTINILEIVYIIIVILIIFITIFFILKLRKKKRESKN